jgi:hypothetical protein
MQAATSSLGAVRVVSVPVERVPALPVSSPAPARVADAVEISPVARAQSELAVAGGVAAPQEFEHLSVIIGDKEPNLELKSAMVEMAVHWITQRRLESFRASHTPTGESVSERTAAAVARAKERGLPDTPEDRRTLGERFPSSFSSALDDSTTVSGGTLVTADGQRVGFSLSVGASGDASAPAAPEGGLLLSFGGDADALGSRRFAFTVDVAGPDVGDISVWEHTPAGASLAAVGVPGAGLALVGE